jgi:hypothetical protein
MLGDSYFKDKKLEALNLYDKMRNEEKWELHTAKR